MERKAVFIAGMPRSGTSGLCGALAKLGVYFGEPEQLYPADAHNQEGYWEHKKLNAAVRRFHMSLNLAGLDLDPMPEDWRERPLTGEMTEATLAVLRKSFHDRPLWGWKDPQASTLLPFIRDLFSRLQVSPSVAICVRNPLDVARSQKARHGTSETQTLSCWSLATLSALKDSCEMRRSVIVYERFLRDPRRMLEPIVGNLEFDPTEEQWNAAVCSVRPELSHSQSGLETLPPLFQTVYEMCLRTAEEPETLSQEEVDDLWSQWLCWHDLFTRPTLPEATFGVSWERAGERQVSETPYVPKRSWQTLKSTCAALPGSRVSLWMYPLPALVWIRKAVWKREGCELDAQLLPGAHGQLDEQAGVKRVWLYSGREQVAAEAPSASGRFELELQVLIETSTVIAGMTFQELSRRERR